MRLSLLSCNSATTWIGPATAKALGIPFRCLGAAEMNESYRNIMVANNSDIQHLYQTLEDMLESKPCTLHPLNHMCQSCPDGSSPSLLVTGSPCNPYSTRRAKRFAEDSISEHSMTTTTMESVVSTYRKYEPHTGIMEQVTGFSKRTSHSNAQSPYEQFPECNGNGIFAFGKSV